MNEFIKLRKSIPNFDSTYDFTQVLLNNYIEKENKSIGVEEQFLNRIDTIVNIDENDKIDEETLLKLLSYIGEDPYIDRYAMNIITSIANEYSSANFKSILSQQFNDIDNLTGDRLYQMLDLILEFNFELLSMQLVINLLDNNKRNLDTVTLLIEYINQFKLDVSKDYLYKLLREDYPDTIKMQILDVFDNLYQINNLNLDEVKEFENKKNRVFINNYLEFLQGKQKREAKGVVLLQSMFYGDFEDSGKGNNGGLAILLRSLGNEISTDNRIGTVITITISDDMRKPFMAYYQDNHLFFRLPAYLNRDVADPFIKRELFIKRYIKNFLNKLNIHPDIFHARYLDNASMAVAKLSNELNKKLVLTLAPDPHRNMADASGKLKNFKFEETQILLNKIKIGDKLIHMSDKILGIGGSKVNKELSLYFPQFTHADTKYKLKMIAEGIKTDKDMFKNAKEVDVCDLSELIGINSSFCDKPIILNVGRLAKLKGQEELFKAWSTSKLHESHNLLIIGGDLEDPNEEEKGIIDFFNQQIKEQPELEDKFFHKRAMPNENIKSVEKSIMKNSFDFPHIYLASSIKEEFGIAILEAMSRGFLVLAPIKGGVKSYITNRKNGFLIDTSNYKTIAKDAQKILYDSNISKEEFKQIQESGKETVDKNFSIDKIAVNFTDTYLSLLGGKEDEI